MSLWMSDGYIRWQDECLDEDEDNNFAEVGEAMAPESFEMFLVALES